MTVGPMRRITYSDLISIFLDLAAWIVDGLISIVALRAILMHN